MAVGTIKNIITKSINNQIIFNITNLENLRKCQINSKSFIKTRLKYCLFTFIKIFQLFNNK